MNTPKISVVVPVYKVEPYLDRCVKSIVNQTYKNLEIILVDDGSSDRCPQMCDDWQKKDDRIVVIHKENGGVSSARNAALDVAAGEYVSFIDGDDFIAEDFIETLFNLCVGHGCDIAQCDFSKVCNDDIITDTAKVNDVKIFSNIEMLDNLFNERCFQTIVLWSKLYRKKLFENIRFPLIAPGQDEATVHKIIYCANKVAVTGKRMYMYYENLSSVTQGTYGRNRLDAVYMFEERIRFFENNSLKELKGKAMAHYCEAILLAYNKSKRYIPNCQDVLNELMKRYRRVYKSVIFQKNTPRGLRIKFAVCRFFPRFLSEAYVQ